MEVLKLVSLMSFIACLILCIVFFFTYERRKTYLCIQEFKFLNKKRCIVVKKIKAKNEMEAEMVFKHLTKEMKKSRNKGIDIQEWKHIKTHEL